MAKSDNDISPTVGEPYSAAEALSKIWFSDPVELPGVEEAWRLHRGPSGGRPPT